MDERTALLVPQGGDIRAECTAPLLLTCTRAAKVGAFTTGGNAQGEGERGEAAQVHIHMHTRKHMHTRARFVLCRMFVGQET